MRSILLLLLLLTSKPALAEEFPNPIVSVSYDQSTGIVTLIGDVFTTRSDNVWAIEGFDSTGFRTIWSDFKPTTKREINIRGVEPWCIQAIVMNGNLKAVSDCIRL